MNNLKIENYRFGKIVINGKLYQKDLIIFPDRILPNWRREQGHSLIMSDMEDVVATQPKVIIIGTGMFARIVIPQTTLTDLKNMGIEVIAEKTTLACQIFNQRLVDDGIVAALHLTC